MNGECCGSREEGKANDIPATLVVVYYRSVEMRKGILTGTAKLETTHGIILHAQEDK